MLARIRVTSASLTWSRCLYKSFRETHMYTRHREATAARAKKTA
jgi:hypothetical protein